LGVGVSLVVTATVGDVTEVVDGVVVLGVTVVVVVVVMTLGRHVQQRSV